MSKKTSQEYDESESLSESADNNDVVLKKEDYSFLVDSIKNLTEKVTDLQKKSNGILDLEYVDVHYAFVRFYDGKMVRSHTKCWNAKDPEDSDRKTPWIGAIVDGEQEPVPMPLHEFMENLEKKRVKILERIVVDKGERIVGTTPVIKYDYANYKALDTGVRVAQRVTTPIYNIKVEFEDGTVETLPEEGVIGQ